MGLNRRTFLKSSMIAGASLVFPQNISCKNPNSKLNIAVIGVGGRGHANFSPVLKSENIVAMCDVDENRAKGGYEKIKSEFPNVKKFTDYRIMFDKMHKSIDAVIISTPDHTHFIPAFIAMQLGIHVYMEKPLAHNVFECRTLKKAANYYKVTTQMGTLEDQMQMYKNNMPFRMAMTSVEILPLGLLISLLVAAIFSFFMKPKEGAVVV